MVKPQFELGRGRVGKGGVVRDPATTAARRSSTSPRPPRELGLAAARLRRRRGCPGRRATARPSSGAAPRRRASTTSSAAIGEVEPVKRRLRAVLITHSHPPATTEAARSRRRAAAAERRLRAASPTRERARQARRGRRRRRGRRASFPATPDLCLVLGGDGTILRALRRYAGTGVPVFGDQLRHGRLPRRGRARRARATGSRARSPASSRRSTLPGLEVDGRAARRSSRVNDVSLHPPPAGPRRRAQLQRRRRGGRARALRRPGRRHAGRIDRLQPRQQRPDPGLGRGGLRRSASSPRTRSPRARWSSPPATCSTSRNAASREPVDIGVDGSARRRRSAPARRSRSASATASACSPSSRARLLPAASARSSAGSRH